MTFIYSSKAAPVAGHYAPAVVHNGLVYVSGILPITAAGEKLTEAPLARQVETVFYNLRAILLAAGSAPDQVLQVRIYVTDIGDWGDINRLYAAFFGDHKPARAVVPVPALHYGLKLELEATAAVLPTA
ncbi:RidA family protein [Fibrivirga algicola]|uniref:RidA family protein n=1 Tax=Fibrivirga algicola TaxID=2950420 RepID=A0ABX0QL97_9BACT|nr:RidA family protein [Fibrivirga algicola]NID12036.1 RidA family protein [Fibrivirga algicola]